MLLYIDKNFFPKAKFLKIKKFQNKKIIKCLYIKIYHQLKKQIDNFLSNGQIQ